MVVVDMEKVIKQYQLYTIRPTAVVAIVVVVVVVVA